MAAPRAELMRALQTPRAAPSHHPRTVSRTEGERGSESRECFGEVAFPVLRRPAA